MKVNGASTAGVAARAPQETTATISLGAVRKAIGVEIDRTLPFWRCYVDLRLSGTRRSGARPTVMSRETEVACRIPCSTFAGVDVVVARTHVVMRLPMKLPPGKGYSSSGSVVQTSRFWRDVEYKEVAVTLLTMHFVHRGAHQKDSQAADRSFHVQSVVCVEQPAVLQCVAGTMVNFAFIVYSSLRLLAARRERGRDFHPLDEMESAGKASASTNEEGEPATISTTKEALWGAYFPTRDCRVLVLGMGGNSMALSLRSVLGPDANIHVVEMETAVVQACREVGTLTGDPNTHVHLQEAKTLLGSDEGAALFFGKMDMVFMDLFEPMEAKMDKCSSLVHLCERTLRPGGLLIVNDHQLPSTAGLMPFCDLFGADNVQAVNLHGWNECVITCVRPGNPEVDGLSSLCVKRTVQDVHDIYEVVLPGWLPHISWLKSSGKLSANCPCRVWQS